MKHLLIIMGACLLGIGTQAQDKKVDTLTYQLAPTFNFNVMDSVANRRNQLNQTNLSVLLAWSAANIVQGSISAGNLTGSKQHFHRMNAYFNTVNLAIAGYGLLRLHQTKKLHYTLADNVKAQQKISSLLLLNSGLDIAYMTTGVYLQERGNNLNNDQTKGYGSSLILQGAFLLVFDLIQYVQHQQNGKLLNQYLGNLQLTTTQNGVGLVVPL
ncbi:MAG: hypothetical protein ABL870_07610 [Sediminibacterium sp.]